VLIEQTVQYLNNQLLPTIQMPQHVYRIFTRTVIAKPHSLADSTWIQWHSQDELDTWAQYAWAHSVRA